MRIVRFFIAVCAAALLFGSVSAEDANKTSAKIQPKISVQMGHSGAVNSVVFSPDGRFALSGSLDTTLKLWDLSNGREIRTFSGHSDFVLKVAISPDGKYALSGSLDKTMKLWDLASGKELRAFKGHTSDVSSVAFSPDGKYVLSGSRDSTVRLWDVSNGRLVRTFSGNSSGETAAVFSPDGRYILTVTSDTTLKLWELSTGKEVRTFFVMTTYHIGSVAFSPDGRYILSSDKILRLFDVETGRELRQFTGHSGFINSIAFNHDGRYALSSADDYTVKLWEISSGRELKTFDCHSFPAFSVAFSPDGLYVLAGLSDRSLLLWEVITGREIMKIGGSIEDVHSVSFSPDCRFLLTGLFDNTLRLWELGIGREVRSFTGHSGYILTGVFSPDGKYVLSGSWDNSINLYEVVSGQVLKSFKGHSGYVLSVVFSPDGRYALSGSLDSTLKLWEVESGREIRTYRGHSAGILSIALSPDGRYAISGSIDNTIKLWDVFSGQEIRALAGHSGTVTAVKYSPDGRYILSGSVDKTLRIWDAMTGRELCTFNGHSDTIASVTFSPDGKYALSGSWDKSLKLWEVSTSREIRTFKGHDNGVNSVAFSTNGRFAISGSDDGSTRLWNISDDTWTAFLSGSGKNAGKWLIYTHDGYWDGSNDCGDLVAMVRGMDCWNIDQFAVKNNRPDIILSRLPGSDQKLIAHYRALYEKRLRKLGLTEAALSSDYHVPEAKILDSKQEGKFVSLRFSLSDSRENLKFYNIYVNDVPLFGATGKPLSGKSSVLTERIELVAGTNKIELSCMNARGAESFRPAVYVDCDVKIKPNLYFIGFGVSKYQNRLAGKSVDLAYAAKDAEDLAGLYLRMQGNIYEKVFVKTFLDSEATKANLKSAKSFLDGARPEDTFVLFISGHGKYVGDTYYYITHETDFKNIHGTAADFELVEDLLQGIAPRQKLFLMDTCESGEREGEAQVALAEGGRGLRPRALPVEKGLRIMAPVEGFLLEKKDRYIYNDLARRSGSIVFSSSRGDERSLEADEYQNGLFTALLKRALAGNADKDKNKSVDVRELVDYVSAEVPGVAETLSKRENLNFTQHPTVDRDNIYIKFGFPVVR